MANSLTRRGFMHGGILATVASATSSLAWSREFFCSSEGGDALCRLVIETLHLKPRYTSVVRQFIHALQTGEIEQTETSEFVQELLANAARSQDALGRYVVGEFVARTNYYEFSAGLEPELIVLDMERAISIV